MKAIKLFVTSILLLSSFQALAVMRNVIIIIAAVVIPPHPIERGVMEAKFDVDENVQMEIKVPGKDDLILVKSNMMDQFSISANGERVIMKPQDFETTTEDPWIIARERNNANLDIKLTYEIYDVDEAPTIQLSNSTILNGSAAYTRIGQITANDVDSDNTKLEYSLSGVDKEYFLLSSSKMLIIKNKVDMAVKSRYSIEIHVSDPAGNSASKEFTITVEPSLAITTTDISTPENADKVINLTANKGGADFFIAGGADENKFSLSGTTLTFEATDFEARDDKTYSVEITANRLGAEDRPDEITTKTVTVTVTDLEEAPTDIQINNAFFIDDQVILANDKSANFLIGTLSAADTDITTDLTFTTTSAYFKIVNNELRTKLPLTAIGDMDITITARDGTQSIDETFDIKVVDGSQFLLSEITNANISVRENFDIALPLYTLTNELSDENWSYSLLGRDEDFFDLAVSPKGVVVVTFKDSPNYESKSTYSLVLKVSREINNVTCVATKTIIITIIDPKSNDER